MLSLNRVQLLGNVGQNPEVKTSQNNLVIAKTSIATRSGKKNPDGTWSDVTDWHQLVAFGKTAVKIRDHVRKGSLLFVEGRLQTSQFNDQAGNKRYITEVVINDFKSFDGAGRAGADSVSEDNNQTGDIPF